MSLTDNKTSGIDIDEIDDKTVVFKFTNGSLKVTIKQGDLSKETCDAIVNPTNTAMKDTGGLDRIVHQYMGEFFTDQVTAMTAQLGREACPLGQSRLFIARSKTTEGCARYVINTVGPVYKNGEESQAEFDLKSCYYTSLKLAEMYAVKSIAYPAISCGANHYPPDKAAKVSIEVLRGDPYSIRDFRFVLFSPDVYKAFVDEWRDYAEKINRNARATDERDRPIRPIFIPTTPPTPTARYCVFCKDQKLPNNCQFLCIDCSKLSRTDFFIKFLQSLRSSADDSFAELEKQCKLLCVVLSVHKILYNPIVVFDQNIHKRDPVAEYYLQSQCERCYRSNAMPMAIAGDGNCFYNTFVKLSSAGTTSDASSLTPVELRARNIVELVTNRKFYEEKYQSLSNILDPFEEYVTGEMVRDTNYTSVWDFLSISTVLDIKVIAVYPKVNGESDLNYKYLNGVQFCPLGRKVEANASNHPEKTVDIKILFSNCNKPVQLGNKDKSWMPNHFVPILDLS